MLLILSCGTQTEDGSIVTLKRELVSNDIIPDLSSGTIKLMLDSLSPSNSHATQFFCENDSCFIVIMNLANMSIDFYQYPTGELVKRIKPSAHGPDGVSDFHGFLVISKDSVVLIHSYARQIFIIDDSGHVVKKISLLTQAKSKEEKALIIEPYSVNKRFAVYKNDSLFMTGAYDASNYELFFHAAETFLSVDLVRDKFYQGLPHPIQNKNAIYSYNYHLVSFVQDLNSRDFIFNYAYDDYLYKGNIQGHREKFIASTEHTESEVQVLDKAPETLSEFNKHYSTNKIYSNIISDPYRKLYYRFVYHPMEDYHAANILDPLEQATKRSFSIIVFNSNYEIQGEAYFKSPHNFVPGNAIVTQDGLLIQTIGADEAAMEFSVVKLF